MTERDLAKSIQNMTKAKMVLSMPIHMTYEFWTYLHKIVDGDDV